MTFDEWMKKPSGAVGWDDIQHILRNWGEDRTSYQAIIDHWTTRYDELSRVFLILLEKIADA